MSLSLTDILALSPLIILLLGALILLLVESFADQAAKWLAPILTPMTLLFAIYAACYAPVSHNIALTRWLRFDALSHFFNIFFLVVGLASTLLASSFFSRFKTTSGEYFFLLLIAIMGLMLTAASADFLTLFLGIEILSLSLYVLCGYMKSWEFSHEAAMKYFFMGSIAAAFLLYGIALVYGAVGSTQFSGLLSAYQKQNLFSDRALFLGGLGMITCALAFKAAVVPFHVWAPDVYDGAPTPVTAFMAVGVKAGAFAALIRLFLEALPHADPLWNDLAIILIIATLVFANFMALVQVHLRRFFAYSGISHAGFLLIPLASMGADSLSAILFYLLVYAIATLGAFAVLTQLDRNSRGVDLQDLKGLFYRSPWMASVMTFCLLTLAGIPPTAGFFAKFYVLKTAFAAGNYLLVVVGLLATILSIFYYLRIITTMLKEERQERISSLWPATVVGFSSLAVIVWLSVFPNL